MENRYARNIPAISKQEQDMLKNKKVLAAGCGGLGGYIIEHLVRLGVGDITVADGDVFQESNLNRQLLCTETVLGQSKVQAALERAAAVNSSVKTHGISEFLDSSNADTLVSGQDLVLDALDNVQARLILEDACARQNVPLVHGAICGWQAQVCTVLPGSGILHKLYGGVLEASGENSGSDESVIRKDSSAAKTALPFTPALCASIQCAEALKLLCGRSGNLVGKLAVIDLEGMEWDVVPLE